MKKALIHIGAGLLQRDSLACAREIGLHVVATDVRSDAAGACLADEFYQVSGNDRAALVSLADEVGSRFEIVAAYAGSDFGLLPAACIHQRLGLKGCSPETVLLALDKFKAKEIFIAEGIETPKGTMIDRAARERMSLGSLRLPLIVKPVGSCGSQGVMSVISRSGLDEAISAAFLYDDRVMVEELFEGVGVDTIGIMWDGELIPCGIGNRFFSHPPLHFPLYGHCPPRLSCDEIAYAYALTGRAARALGIDYSPVKADLLYRDGQFTILEVTPRFHGDIFTAKLIPNSCGASPNRFLFELQAGLRRSLSLGGLPSRPVVWRALYPLSSHTDFSAVAAKLEARWSILDFSFDPGRFKKASGHCDTTGLVGYFLVALDSIHSARDFEKDFQSQFAGVLL